MDINLFLKYVNTLGFFLGGEPRYILYSNIFRVMVLLCAKTIGYQMISIIFEH